MNEIRDMRYLGKSDQATVYLAELHGIEMALARFKDGGQSRSHELVIFSDSQAAIQALQNPKRPSGQFVLAKIYEHHRAILSQVPAPAVSLRWVPAHVGISGNEAADEAAKEAAQNEAGQGPAPGSSEPDCGLPNVQLATNARRRVRLRLQTRWVSQWKREKTGGKTRRLIEEPSKKTLRLYERLPKAYSSIAIQMRSGRIDLNHPLFKINMVDSGECACGEGSETPPHILLRCSLHTAWRDIMFDRIQGTTDLGRTSDFWKLVDHPRAIRYVAQFMHRTGRLGQFAAVDDIDIDTEFPEEDQEPIGLAAIG